MNTPRQGLPPYYTRGVQDRRQHDVGMARSQPEEIHREPATLDMFTVYTHPGCDPV